MRVSRIEFNGYRRLAKTATGIDGPLTAFIGFNEAGKTTVLRGLRWFTHGGQVSPVDHNRSRPPASDHSAVVKVFYELDDDDKNAFADIAMDNQPTTLVLYKKRDGNRIRSLSPRPTRPAKRSNWSADDSRRPPPSWQLSSRRPPTKTSRTRTTGPRP